MIRNGNKVSYIRIKKKNRKEILNIYHSMENGTWLCDKSIISNHKIIVHPSLFIYTTSLRIKKSTKM